MTKILPVEAVRTGPPLAVPHRAAGRPSRARLAVLNVASRVTLRPLPKIPDRVKRLLLGGRTITIDGNTLDTTLQLMLALQRSSRVGGLVASADIAVARSQLRKLAAIIAQPIAVGVADIALPGPAGPMRARHYTPVNTVPAEPLLVFFHGGGFSIGDIETHDGLCRLLCRDGGVHVLSVDYRLAPEHKAPAAQQDCYAAYRWALEHATELGADPTRIAVGGDSAGGNLATVVSQAGARRRCATAGPAAAAVPGHAVRRGDTVDDALRRRLLPRQGRHGLVPRQLPVRDIRRVGGPVGVAVAGRRPLRPAACAPA